MGKYIKHNSNYIKTNRHQFLKGGSTIFERDWVTIGGRLHFGPGKIPYYENGNFVFTKTLIPFYQKKFKNGVNVSTWTYEDVENASPVINEVNFDEYTEDIRSFAYYGSCVELVRSTVEKIVKEFPGIITNNDYEIQYTNPDETAYIDSGYYEIKNDFGIDLINQIANKGEDENKFLRLSYGNYLINGEQIDSYDVIERTMYILKDESCISNRKAKLDFNFTFKSKIECSLLFGDVPFIDGKTGKQYWVNLKFEQWENDHQEATDEEKVEKRIELEQEYDNTRINGRYVQEWNSGKVKLGQFIVKFNEGKQRVDRDGNKMGYCYVGYGDDKNASNNSAKNKFKTVKAHNDDYDHQSFKISQQTTFYIYFNYGVTKKLTIESVQQVGYINFEIDTCDINDTFQGNNGKKKYITLYNEYTLEKKYNYLQAVSNAEHNKYKDDRDGYKGYVYWNENKCPLEFWTKNTSFKAECDKYFDFDNDDWKYIRYSTLSPFNINQPIYEINIKDIQGIPYKIVAYILNGKLVFMTQSQIVIRPNDEVYKEYFNSLEGFEKQLLTRKSNPLYSNQFITPLEYDNGYVYYNRTYTWPSDENGCIDISSINYINFINKLVKTAETYDELCTDNLWRRMTHEAIKNYDWTYSRYYNDGDEEANVYGGERMHNVINVIGRVFDDIKRKIDTIKQFNRITYGSSNNIPNALLSDKLDLMGWDVYSTIPMIEYEKNENDDETTFISASDEVITYDFLHQNDLLWYPSKNPEDVSFADVDIEWMRRFILTSKRILSTKGTVNAIEMLMGMFGYGFMDKNRPFEIWEEYNITKPINYDEKVYAKYNDNKIDKLILEEEYDKISEDTEKRSYEEYPLSFGDLIVKLNNSKFNEKIYDDDASGIPVGSFVINRNGETKYNYLIPFYDKNKWYDGNMFFQCNGGWAYNKNGEEDENKYSWTETLSYLHVVSQVSDLLNVNPNSVDEGDIFYVTNVNDYFDNTETGLPLSNFFVLENVYAPEEFSSWTCIDITGEIYDPENPEDVKYINYVTKANYLNDIIPYNIGNNPHVGYGKYDKGKEYFDYMEQPFKYAIDTYNFTYDDQQIAEKITFEISKPIEAGNIGSPRYMYYELTDSTNTDNDKYISPSYYYSKLDKDKQELYDAKYLDIDEFNEKLHDLINSFNSNNSSNNSGDTQNNIISCCEKVSKTKVFANGYDLKNIENDNRDILHYKEYVMENIITLLKTKYYLNNKVFHIKNKLNNVHYLRYFKDVILKYLLQIIPSTTILILEDFEYKEESNEG